MFFKKIILFNYLFKYMQNYLNNNIFLFLIF